MNPTQIEAQMRDIAAEVRQVSSSSEPVSRSVWAPMVGVPVVEVGDVRMCVRLRVVVVRVRMSWNDRLVDPGVTLVVPVVPVVPVVMVIVMVIVMVVVLVGVVHRLVTVDVEVVGPERERDTGAGEEEGDHLYDGHVVTEDDPRDQCTDERRAGEDELAPEPPAGAGPDDEERVEVGPCAGLPHQQDTGPGDQRSGGQHAPAEVLVEERCGERERHDELEVQQQRRR